MTIKDIVGYFAFGALAVGVTYVVTDEYNEERSECVVELSYEDDTGHRLGNVFRHPDGRDYIITDGVDSRLGTILVENDGLEYATSVQNSREGDYTILALIFDEPYPLNCTPEQ
jgi:hypothetical protein